MFRENTGFVKISVFRDFIRLCILSILDCELLDTGTGETQAETEKPKKSRNNLLIFKYTQIWLSEW